MYKKWKYCHRKQPVENLDVRSSRYHYSKKAGGGGGGGGGGVMGTPGPPLATSLQLSEKMNTLFTLLMNKGCFQWVSLEKH